MIDALDAKACLYPTGVNTGDGTEARTFDLTLTSHDDTTRTYELYPPVHDRHDRRLSGTGIQCGRTEGDVRTEGTRPLPGPVGDGAGHRGTERGPAAGERLRRPDHRPPRNGESLTAAYSGYQGDYLAIPVLEHPEFPRLSVMVGQDPETHEFEYREVRTVRPSASPRARISRRWSTWGTRCPLWRSARRTSKPARWSTGGASSTCSAPRARMTRWGIHFEDLVAQQPGALDAGEVDSEGAGAESPWRRDEPGPLGAVGVAGVHTRRVARLRVTSAVLRGGRAGVPGRPALPPRRRRGVAPAGTARGWLPARGLGMATFANPLVSPPSRRSQMAFLLSTTTCAVAERQQKVSACG